jgi:hypothetical protein
LQPETAACCACALRGSADVSIGSDYLTAPDAEFERLRRQTNRGQAGWGRGPGRCRAECGAYDRANERQRNGGREAKCLLALKGAPRIPGDSLVCDRKIPQPGAEKA